MFLGATILGLFAGFGRIVQGGHFLSDVVFTGIFVFAIAWILYRVLRIDAHPDGMSARLAPS